jgi:hypothetical protein
VFDYFPEVRKDVFGKEGEEKIEEEFVCNQHPMSHQMLLIETEKKVA